MMNEKNTNLINIATVKQKDLLNLPLKLYTEVHRYDSIIVCPTRRKHDSGWRLMALIGCKKINGCCTPVHLIGYCDDINWKVEHVMAVDAIQSLRSDMTLSNCIRFWSNDFEFKVGTVCSSTDIYICKK